MTSDDDLHPHDDLAIYALDALDPDEHAALEEHLAGCAACRAELEEHRTTLARLVVPAEEPPPSVWAGIAQQLPQVGGAPAPGAGLPDAGDTAADRGGHEHGGDHPDHGDPSGQLGDLGDPAGHSGDDHLRVTDTVVPLHAPLHVRRRSLADRAGWLAAAAAFVVVLGLGAVLVTRGGDDAGTETDLADLAAAAGEAPGATVVPLESEGGDRIARVVLAGEAGTTDYVIFDAAVELPAGRSYQLWKTDGGPPVSLGVLGDGSAGAVAIAAPADLTSLALSEEPEAGVPQPTGAIVATGTRS